MSLLGTYSGIVEEQRKLDVAKEQGVRLRAGYSRKRAFTHNPTENERKWFTNNLAVADPLILDMTAGGGSIPFEAGRLGLRTIANDLNPVASLVLRACCQWPQAFGHELLKAYDAIQARFKKRVNERLEGVYPEEAQPASNDPQTEKLGTARAHRYVWAYLWARAVPCPSCQ